MKTKDFSSALSLMLIFIGLALVMFELMGVTSDGYLLGAITLAASAVLSIGRK